MKGEQLELRTHARVAEIPEASWDALLTERSTPFLEWGWLDALEEAGCVRPERGWLPRHLSLWRGDTLVAVAPAYLKGNSEGEFVFDHAWANVSQRLGIEYFPKLLLAVPFTPATGERVLVRPGEERAPLVSALARGLGEVARELDVSSVHVLFPNEADTAPFEQADFALRLGVQFHWQNRGYATFDDFLATFNAKRRHQLRRERRLVAEQGVTVRTLRGDEITDDALRRMYAFYLATVDKFVWGRRYLNEAFFFLVRDRFARKANRRSELEIVIAEHEGKVIAGAFNMSGGGRLYGRYWGAVEERPFLHFEVCYYHSIDQCITRGLTAFEPGAGGEHKVPRGFEPTLTRSAHLIRDRRLRSLVVDYLARERAAIAQAVASGDAEELG